MAMSRLHENLEVGICIIILQVTLGPKETSTREPASRSPGEDLCTFNGHAQAVKHEVSAAVLRTKGLLRDLQTWGTVNGAVDSGHLANEEVTVQILIIADFLILKITEAYHVFKTQTQLTGGITV